MIYATIEPLLSEFFIDIQESNVGFSLGDLFDPSHVRIKDVFLKTQIINALHFPFELAAGYIGDFKIEGLIGAVAGAPLTLLVSDMCLVLRHKDVDWSNELLFRYTNDLLVTLLQSITSPSFAKKVIAATADATKKTTFISPIKWLSSRFQAAIADMTIKLERLHVRYESVVDAKPTAFGVYIASLQFATHGVDTQILRRRVQRSVTYPNARDCTRSKVVTLEHLSVYCDVDADAFVASDTSDAPAPASLVLEQFRAKALERFQSDARRDLFVAPAVWIKLDLNKTSTSDNDPAIQNAPTSSASSMSGRVAVAAVDVVVETLKLHADFAQLGALSHELTRLVAFRQLTHRQQLRPSCIDRDTVAPPVVATSPTALLPIVPVDAPALLSFPRTKQRRTSLWFRHMWQFATWCVLVDKHSGNTGLVRFVTRLASRDADASSAVDSATRCRRYVELYTRSLSGDALQAIVHGKKLLWASATAATSPRKPTDVGSSAPSLLQSSVPALEPLTRAEQWELSDLVFHLPVAEQRQYRSVADAALRTFKATASPTRAPTGTSAVTTAPLQTVESSLTPPLSSSKTTSLRLTDLPANSSTHQQQQQRIHHHIMRSATESTLPSATSKLAQLHVNASTSVLLHKSPLTNDTSKLHSPSKPTSTHSHLPPPPTSASPLVKQRWVQQVFIPSWIRKRHPPLLNWNIGAISLCIFRDHATSSRTSAPSSPARSPRGRGTFSFTQAPPRNLAARAPTDEFLKVGIERVSGAALISSALQSPSFLLELRLGLFHATLFSPSHQRALAPSSSSSSRANTIASDYIKDPDDGSLYIGLRFSPHDDDSTNDNIAPVTPTPSPATATVAPGESSSTNTMDATLQQWGMKGKLCVGPLTIDYNELALQTTLATAASIPLTKSVDLASSTYVALVLNVVRSWRELFQRYRQRKQRVVVARADGFYTQLLDPVGSAAARLLEQAQQHAAKRARIEQLIHAAWLIATALDVELGGLKLTASLLTSHVEQLLATGAPQAALFNVEDVRVALPPTTCSLQTQPQRNECCVRAAGATLQLRSTPQGLAAATEFLLRHLTGKE